MRRGESGERGGRVLDDAVDDAWRGAAVRAFALFGCTLSLAPLSLSLDESFESLRTY